MFSIWMNGMADFLKRMGVETTMLTSLLCQYTRSRRRGVCVPAQHRPVLERIQQISEDVLQINQGSLYPALQRLEKTGLISSEWGTTDNNRRARYYELTTAGRRALGEELESWRRFAAGLETVLRTS